MLYTRDMVSGGDQTITLKRDFQRENEQEKIFFSFYIKRQLEILLSFFQHPEQLKCMGDVATYRQTI